MKAIILFVVSLILFAGISKAAAQELPASAKQLVLGAIAEYVYLEVDGKVRAPQKISDFVFTVINADKIVVKGNSFSQLDNKIIGYTCDVELLGRGVIESIYDFELVGCSLKL